MHLLADSQCLCCHRLTAAAKTRAVSWEVKAYCRTGHYAGHASGSTVQCFESTSAHCNAFQKGVSHCLDSVMCCECPPLSCKLSGQEARA